MAELSPTTLQTVLAPSSERVMGYAMVQIFGMRRLINTRKAAWHNCLLLLALAWRAQQIISTQIVATFYLPHREYRSCARICPMMIA
jgi:hypothetical protein